MWKYIISRLESKCFVNGVSFIDMFVEALIDY